MVLDKVFFKYDYTPIKLLYETGTQYQKLRRLFDLGIIKRTKRKIDDRWTFCVYPSWEFPFLLEKVRKYYIDLLRGKRYFDKLI